MRVKVSFHNTITATLISTRSPHLSDVPPPQSLSSLFESQAVCFLTQEGKFLWGSPSFMASLGGYDASADNPDKDVFVAAGQLEEESFEISETAAPEEIFLEAVRTPVRLGDSEAWMVTLVPSKAHKSRAEEISHFQTIAENAPVATFFSGGGLRLEYVNLRFCDLVGTPKEKIVGTGWLRNLPAATATGLSSAFEQALHGVRVEETIEVEGGEQSLLVKVEPLSSPRGGAGFIGIIEDVTERAATYAQLLHQAGHDALTGLPNRATLWNELKRLLPGNSGDMAVLFIDLDNFKLLNDSLGHDVGDELLIRLSHKLQRTVRRGDIVARYGGDEFILVGCGVRNENDAALFAKRVLDAVVEPVDLKGVLFTPSASIGVALAQSSHKDPQDIIKDADMAMYKAKKSGKNRWSLCDDETRRSQRDRLLLITDLRLALEQNELELHYQPIVDLKTGALTKVEAFARWEHPERGPIAPLDFIPLVEDANLSDELTRFTLSTACNQMHLWAEKLDALAPPKVSINISIGQVTENLIPLLKRTLESNGLQPSQLCLEVTESTVMSSRDGVRERLIELSRMGVNLSIDDFGTGVFSLTYLRDLPVKTLKVDSTFVSDLTGQGQEAEQARTTVAAVIALASSLGMEAIAEGVETAEQAQTLLDLGCHRAQGFFFHAAVTPSGIESFVGGTQ